MNITAIVEALVNAGATPDMILAAVRTAEGQKDAAVEASKTKARDRVARWRETHRKQSSNVTERSVTSHNAPQRLTRAEDRTSNLDTEGKKEEKEVSSAPAVPSPRVHLESVLDAERADAVLEHRKRIRFPLTSHAAKLLAKDFAKCPDPNAAADQMVKSGWRGFDPSWMDKPQQRAGPGTQAPSMSEMFRVIGDRVVENQPGPPEDRSGFRAAIPHLRTVGSG